MHLRDKVKLGEISYICKWFSFCVHLNQRDVHKCRTMTLNILSDFQIMKQTQNCLPYILMKNNDLDVLFDNVLCIISKNLAKSKYF